MSETTLVALPCRVITLRVELGSEEGASTLEELVLAAVAGGRTTVDSLGDLFSLPRRLMLDVVHALWSRGFLAVDFTSHTLEGTPAAEAVLGDGDGAQTVATSVDARKFLFDPVTETILPYRDGSVRAPLGALEMPVARGVSAEDLPQTELLRAVRRAVAEDRRDRGVRRRVLNVSFTNPVLSPPEAVRWSTVEVVVKRDPGSGQIAAVPVEAPPGWGRRGAQLFQAHITHLLHTRPESAFVKKLLNRQVPEVVRPDTLKELIRDLEQLAEGLDDAPELPDLPGRHHALEIRTNQLREQISEARRSRCGAQRVAPGAGVGYVVGDLIDRAEHQLVLAAPTIAYEALNPLLPGIEEALKRGVTLVLLWGDHPSAKLEPRSETALFDLKARYAGKVLLEKRSSSSAASLLICDNRAAYVGSRGFLSAETGAGVLVEPSEDTDTPPLCVADLLSWVRRVYPYWDTAQSIAIAPGDFGRTGRGVPAEPARWWRWGPPELPEGWDEDPVGFQVGWAAAWGRVLRELVDAVNDVHRGADPVVRAVWDGAYAEVVGRLVASAGERLAVTDDRAEHEACDETLALRLRRLREAGGVVHLQHPSLSGGRRTATAYDALLKALKTDGTLRVGKARARAVLSDHEMVAGSHHPVGHGATRPGQGAVAQVGLHIVGTSFTADFARELGIPEWFGAAGDSGGAGPEYHPTAGVFAAIPLDDDPWTALAQRERAGRGAEELRRYAAALLMGQGGGEGQGDAAGPGDAEGLGDAEGPGGTEEQGADPHHADPLHSGSHPADPHRSDSERWSRWLLEDAWRRGAFMEAYLLTPLLGGGPGALSVELAAVALPLEHGPFGEQLFFSALALEAAPPEQRTVALAGAVAEMLLHGGDTGRLACRHLTEGTPAEGLPTAWLELARAARACFEAAPAPLPLHDVDEWAAGQERSARTDERWARLAAEVADFEQAKNHFSFTDGQKLHRALFRPDGLLAEVREMAHDPRPADRWVPVIEGLPQGEQEIRTQLDRMSADLGLRKIEWSNHFAYARRLAEFIAEARSLVARTEEGHQGPAALRLSAAQRRFALHLDDSWHQLVKEADELGEPACHPAKALLEALSALPKAGKENA
ncbi:MULTISPECIES: hypothetical protein [Streptomyces]|uniref:hypothetical protein n=1 Tax=Streptomyces TaxID=1883 RepID=UPI001600F1C2|nr:hypothetical protein [Streptomyces murinus]MBA9048681.1 hypothetical protein [Streptomyces murinus]